MNKKILIILIIILFTTGCTCEYNLIIDGDKYKEKVTIIAEDQEEISYINYNWKLPIDKKEYKMTGDYETHIEYKSDLYNYKINNNELIFDYEFNKSKYINSSAVSECYNNLNIDNHNNATIISTSVKAECFETKPTLNKIIVNVTVDREVISTNSDEISGKRHTWYITKNNYKNKPINLTLSNETKIEEDNDDYKEQSNQNKETKNIERKTDYSIYIFLGIVLIVMLFIYLMFNKMKNKNNKMDD